MILVIIASSLITLVAILFGAGIYVILAVLEESDEDEGRAMLGIDTQDFTSTPVVSPHETLLTGNERKQSIRMVEGLDCYCTLRDEAEAAKNKGNRFDESSRNQNDSNNSAILEATDDSETLSNALPSEIVGLSQEDIQSARLNSKLLKASEKQRETAHEAPQSPIVENGLMDESTEVSATEGITRGERPAESVDWQSQPYAQKSKITSLLGATQAKQIFDDLDAREMHSGGTALHWCKTRSILDKLVKLDIPLNAINERRETALHVAIRRHKLQVLIGLVIHGADIEARNGLNETPLIVACKMRNIFAVQLLLIFEANPNTEDDLGLTARHHTASICEHNKAQHQAQAPSAAHLILAMLNEIGARRCRARPSRMPLRIDSEKDTPASHPQEILTKTTNTNSRPQRQPKPLEGRLSRIVACSEGCSSTGIYNGNSYNRWPNFKRESLYKRHMFNDIIESHLSKAQQQQSNRSHNGQPPGSERYSRLLCIDGGGLRGVIVCQILIEMEKYVKQPIASYFDWIGGTSVGAFIACAICIGIPLNQLRQICFDVKDEVFSGGRPYNSQFIERVLKRTFGTKRRLSEIKHKKLAVTTVLADREPCQLRLFRNFTSPNTLLERFGYSSDTFNNMSGHSIVSDTPHTGAAKKPIRTTKTSSDGHQLRNESAANNVETEKTGRKRDENVTIKQVTESERNIQLKTLEIDTDAQNQEQILDENDPDPIIWKVVRASTAAPFFFKPYGPYLDGGIISNNPTLDMLNEFESYQKVRRFLAKHVIRDNVYSTDDSLYADCSSTSKLNLVVSLGTGRGRVISKQAMVDFGQVATGFSTVFSPIELVRSIRAAREIFRKLMQQSCHTDDYILDRAQAWCSSLELPYFRINPPLATIFSIDDKRDEQLINALWQTKLYMRAMKDQLSELAQLLDGPRGG